MTIGVGVGVGVTAAGRCYHRGPLACSIAGVLDRARREMRGERASGHLPPNVEGWHGSEGRAP